MDVIDLAVQYRAAALRRDAAVMRRLLTAYRDLTRRMQQNIDLLLAEIGDRTPTAAQLRRLRRYQEVLEQAAEELRRFEGVVANEMTQASRAEIAAARNEARALLAQALAGDAALGAGLGAPRGGVIETLTAFLDPAGPLYRRLAQLAPYTVEQLAAGLTDGIALGYNPIKLGRLLNRLLGQGLTAALRMTRTVQLYSYREASRAIYVTNEHLLDGWVWFAQLDERTCLSCLAMHGTQHPVTERLNDHHNGRCAMLPLPKGRSNPITQSGAEYFAGLDRVTQLQIAGPGKLEAWERGQIDFADFVGEHADDVYGLMRVERSLADLLARLSAV